METHDTLHKKSKADIIQMLLSAQSLFSKQIEAKEEEFAQQTKAKEEEFAQQAKAKEEEFKETLAEHIQDIIKLRAQVNYLLQRRYGRKSEKGIDPQQGLLFDEPKVENVSKIEAVDEEITVASFNRKKTGRKPLPKELPREERIFDLAENEKTCQCGCSLTEIGFEKSEQLDIIPAVVKVIVNVRKKYACKACEETIKTAALPEQPIPKSIASSGLLSHVLVSKYADHLPLYRQERIFQRMGIDIPRSTLCHWVIRSAQLLAPLVKRMHEKILQYDVAYADETPVQVLKEKDRKPETKSYMWFFSGGPPLERVAIYQYHPTRSGSVANTFFKNYKGYLHCDGYAGYDNLFIAKNITGVGCWAHARRYFIEAQQQAKDVHGLGTTILNEIQKLYFLENQAKENYDTQTQLYQSRQEKSLSILQSIKSILEENIVKTPPESPIRKAINYTLGQWPKLIRYVDDARLEIDNNFSERAMKDFAIGRKNWLFSDNPDGAHASAIIYSFIQTCKIHHVEPYAYLKYVLTKIPTTLNKNIDSLLPFNCPRDILLLQYR